jgi:hypothetical protein
MIGLWVAYIVALAVALGLVHAVGPLPTPPSKPAPVSSMCQLDKVDKAAGGALDPALDCK